jgi:nucleoside phosphorylase
MSMTNAAEAALLDLLFLNVDWANIGDAGGLQNSAAAGSFYISLHTSDPGEAGDQTTNEIAYTSYARVAVARTGGGWTRAVSTISNTALVQFPQCTGGSGTASHFGIGTASSGAGNLILKGALSSSLAISNGIQPQFAATALTATVD